MDNRIVMRLESGGCAECAGPTKGELEISASVGRGGTNRADDVGTIQSALNAQDPADGGPDLKLAVDGLVGPLTIAAIEKYQKRQLGWADGRVDKDGPTIKALNGGSTSGGTGAPQKGAAAPPKKATPEQNRQFIEKLGGLLPKARHWVSLALIKLDMAAEFVRRGPANPKDPFPSLHEIGKSDLGLFNKYFHADKQTRPVQLQQIGKVRHIYESMQTVITGSLLEASIFGWGVGHFQPDPADGTAAANGYVAYTFYGGWHARRKDGKPRLSGDDNYAGDKKLRQDTIFFPVGKLLKRSDNFLLETILHELAHFVGPGVKSGDRIADHTYDTNANFPAASNSIALKTAEMYGYFAAEAALRQVSIPIK